jgi:two-component system, NtrC family, response regulator AtoC
MRVSPYDSSAIETEASLPAPAFPFFVWGMSPAMQRLRRVVTDTARTDIPVLLTGESGTGKEVLALQIHQLSDRRNEPFTKTRCRTLIPDRLTARLKDPVNGGFSNGTFRGTVFLDEINELDSDGQRQLLDLLPDGNGSQNGDPAGARLISTSRRNLEEELRTGKFAEELYFRLNGVSVRIPALRDRKEDIPDLANFFLTKYSTLFERQRPVMTEGLLARLTSYSWPGNVRQLENAMKKIVATGDADVALADLVEVSPDVAKSGSGSIPSLKATARAASRHAERELISRALTRTHWNRKKAALELQISYKALLYKLKQLGLEDSEGS